MCMLALAPGSALLSCAGEIFVIRDHALRAPIFERGEELRRRPLRIGFFFSGIRQMDDSKCIRAVLDREKHVVTILTPRKRSYFLSFQDVSRTNLSAKLSACGINGSLLNQQPRFF